MFRPIVSGGPVMIPLLLCSVVALVIAIERWLYLRHANVDTTRMMQKIRAALERGSPEEARRRVRSDSRTGRPRAGGDPGALRPAQRRPARGRKRGRSGGAAQPRQAPSHPVHDCHHLPAFVGAAGHHLGADSHLPRGVRGRTRRAARPLRRHRGTLITTFTGLAIAIPFLVVYNALFSSSKRSSTKSNCASPNS